MSEPIRAVVVAVLMFSLTAAFSMSVAGLLGGTSRLPLGFRGSASPQRGVIGLSAIAISALLAIAAQLTVIALGLAATALDPLGAGILLAEPVVALLFAWYLTRRYVPHKES